MTSALVQFDTRQKPRVK